MENTHTLTPVTRNPSRRLTRQRQLVLDILNGSTSHPDASFIYLEARKKDDRISLATIYRSLDYLKQVGLVKEDNFGEDHAHFETTQDPRHFHFTCQSCGKLIELDERGLDQTLRSSAQELGLQVTDIQLHLQGYCSDCLKKVRELES